MTEQSNIFDLNTAEGQKSFDVIPALTVVTVQMSPRPGGVGEDGWLKNSSKRDSQGLDCELTVIAPEEHAKKKFFEWFLIRGTTDGHAEAGNISLRKIRAIVESARGIRPDDKSEAAQAARIIKSWGDLNNIRFVAKVGVRPAEGSYPAKNILLEVITPDRQAYTRPQQIAAGSAPGSAPSSTAPSSAAPASAPANTVARPQWAQ
jgi:hypothetical protein